MLIQGRLGALLASTALFAGVTAGCNDNNDDILNCQEFDEFGNCINTGNIDDVIDRTTAIGRDRGDVLADEAEAQFAFNNPILLTGQIGAVMLACNQGIIDLANVELDLGSEPTVLNFATLIIPARENNITGFDTLLGLVGTDAIATPVSVAVSADAAALVAELQTRTAPEVDFLFAQFEVVFLSECEQLADRFRDVLPRDLRDLNSLLDTTQNDLKDQRNQAEELMRSFSDVFTFPEEFPVVFQPFPIPPEQIPPEEIPPEQIPPEQVPPEQIPPVPPGHDH